MTDPKDYRFAPQEADPKLDTEIEADLLNEGPPAPTDGDDDENPASE